MTSTNKLTVNEINDLIVEMGVNLSDLYAELRPDPTIANHGNLVLTINDRNDYSIHADGLTAEAARSLIQEWIDVTGINDACDLCGLIEGCHSTGCPNDND
jgi:hypothetical protein